MKDLNDVLNGSDESEEVTATEEVTEVESAEEATEEVQAAEEVEELTEETPKGEETPAEPPSVEELQKELNAFKAKAQDEKRKRQELEAKKDTETKLPDVLDDNFSDSLLTEAQKIAQNQTLNMSEFLARRDHPDLDAKVEVFEALAASNPAFAQQVFNSPSPYHELVSIVDKHERLEKMENLDEWEAKKTADIEAQVRAKIEAEQKAKAEKTSGITPSLAQTGSSPVDENVWTGPTPITQLLG